MPRQNDPMPTMTGRFEAACTNEYCNEPICREYRSALQQWVDRNPGSPDQSQVIPQPEPEQMKGMNKYIAKMGVEIEGGWHEAPRNRVGDGSVNVHDCSIVGESVSPPYNRFDAFCRYLVDNYPDKVNSTCGLHVHFSFNRLDYYARLMDRPFQEHFVRMMTAWGSQAKAPGVFRERLAGANRYCLNEWNPDKQAGINGKNAHRYAMWNFCYRFHGTAECRLLPCFSDVNMSLSAIRAVKASVLTWLRKSTKDQTQTIIEADEELTVELTRSRREDGAEELLKHYRAKAELIEERI